MSQIKYDGSLDLATLLAAYRSRRATPSSVADAVLSRIAAAGEDGVWITRETAAAVRACAAALDTQLLADPDIAQRLPLFGIPFAVKDNIDVAGNPTSAACPVFAYIAEQHATVVAKLLAAGALYIGKTNLDQFATGLVGIRSPFGIAQNPFHRDYLPGGSSSGSAVAVAKGLVTFALGTDTAGSGRVPAGLNNIVGLKPTRGVFSAKGVVPACPSLDCVSVFALTVDDALRVGDVMLGYDKQDPFSRESAASQRFALRSAPARFRVLVPPKAQLEFFGDAASAQQFAAMLDTVRELGGEIIETDFTPLRDAAALLYQGPWIAERVLVAQEILRTHPEDIHPDVRAALLRAGQYTASDAFAAYHKLKALRRQVRAQFAGADCLLVPTVGRAYRIDEAQADPARVNSNLGYYTNFVNLLDLCAIAVPSGFIPSGMPFGVTMIGVPFSENGLAAMADRLHRARVTRLGATPHPLPPVAATSAAADGIPVCVVGAHLSGLPLNYQLLDRGAHLLRQTQTAPRYRLFALEHMSPVRPGMVRAGESGGVALSVEVWSVPRAEFGAFVAAIPAPLAIGQVELEDGTWVSGFVCQDYALTGARDVSKFGGWRAYLARDEQN